MTKHYFIADTHFGHSNIHMKFRKEFSSQEEHNETIHENIMTCGNKQDCIWLLGDIIFKESEFWRISAYAKKFQQVYYVLGNHCIAEDTEVLTSDGWKISKNITKDDLVASVSLDNKLLTFDTPNNVEIHPPKEMFELKGGYVSELVTTGHSCIIDGDRVQVDSLPNKVKSNRFLFGGNIEPTYKWTENEVSLIAWVVCDGTIVNRSEYNKRIQFKLSKQRKISTLEKLLQECNLPYTKRLASISGNNKLQPYYICLYGDAARYVFKLLEGKKQYPRSLIGISGKVFDCFIKTLGMTDGTANHNTLTLVTVEKVQADTLQMICAANNVPCKIINKGAEASGFPNGKPQYLVSMNLSPSDMEQYVTINKLNIKMASVGIETVNGTIVTRREGKVVVTGNCSKSVWRYAAQHRNISILGVEQRWGLWISHVPIPEYELYRGNSVHGYLHSKPVMIDNGVFTEQDDRYFCVSCEQVDYKPISLNDIKDTRGWK
ncbi:hypothetical protein Barba33A_gp070 [Rheinheimera phage vB_RspM_Barba33A]|uniref:Uncharacterized protein n=1 Tax=Rheinheimera phage vB_RspM_Barba33A TaxID=2565684 RepID=A0A4P8NF70_9CAUD|nr:hypothetical protein Barba33A_gp070 [Rheinheimera phage vB_RspM_Barba33A]